MTITKVNFSITKRYIDWLHQAANGAPDCNPAVIFAREQCDSAHVDYDGPMKDEAQKKKR